MALSTFDLLILVVCPIAVWSAAQQESAQVAANPVRKVVSMLQSMQKKVEAEGETEKDLYSKFSCYCKTGTVDLQNSIAASNTKSPALAAEIKSAEEKLVQLKAELKSAQAERSDAKAATAAATALREKESAAFAAEKAELSANIAAITKSVDALEKGMAGTFLQTGDAQALRKLVLSREDMSDYDKEGIISFLSGQQGSSYVPSGAEVTGILKQLGDSMTKSLADATATEDAAIKTFEELVAAKSKEGDVLTSSIEAKTTQIGDLGVAIVQMKDDLSGTEEALMEDQALLAKLEKGCSTKDSEYEQRVKSRSEELAALAETIKILNDDDALELFKKTLPAPGASLVQVKQSAASVRARALAAALEGRGAGRAGPPGRLAGRSGLDFLVLALKGKKIGFEKIVAMIDEMTATLKKEQLDDDHKKEYCAKQFDNMEDKKKEIERAVSNQATAIASAEEGLAVVTEEIASLEANIKGLDKSVADATAQRKAEHEEYKELMASDGAAKQLLGFAKNRLNKFYAPKLYKPPAKVELSEMGAIERNMGGAAVLAQISEHLQRKSALAIPPKTWEVYVKKSDESTGVIAMIDLLIKDLDKDMTEAETEEKDAQEFYDAIIAESGKIRVSDSGLLTEKSGAKADLEADLLASKGAKSVSQKELMAADKVVSLLHGECDWLLQYFDARSAARAGEVDALTKAKAVLSGADYSLLQTRAASDLLNPGQDYGFFGFLGRRA